MSIKQVLMARRLLGIALAAVVLASCSTLQVGSDYDRKASFANYHSVALMQREHRGTRNPLVVQRTQDAITQELARVWAETALWPWSGASREDASNDVGLEHRG